MAKNDWKLYNYYKYIIVCLTIIILFVVGVCYVFFNLYIYIYLLNCDTSKFCLLCLAIKMLNICLLQYFHYAHQKPRTNITFFLFPTIWKGDMQINVAYKFCIFKSKPSLQPVSKCVKIMIFFIISICFHNSTCVERTHNFKVLKWKGLCE